MDSIRVSAEVLRDQPDLLGQMQRRMVDSVIIRERAALAAVTSWQLAWEVYLPTQSDRQEDWEPYLTRLTDLVPGSTPDKS